RRHTRFSRDWSSDVCSSDLQRLERWQFDGVQTRSVAFNGRKREVRVGACIAVSGEVLRHRYYPRSLEPGQVGGPELRHRRYGGAERADSDNRVVRVAVDIDDRREAHIEAGVGELFAAGQRDGGSEFEVTAGRQGHVAWEDGGVVNAVA